MTEPMRHDHLLCDLWFDTGDVLRYVETLRDPLLEAAKDGGAHVIHSHFHQFQPVGVTGFLLLEESHISLHTWVEERYAALDIFPCGSMDSAKILESLGGRLGVREVRLLEALRGSSESGISACEVALP
jgi:S-adenosylmethionine decarboxylase proenzyme